MLNHHPCFRLCDENPKMIQGWTPYFPILQGCQYQQYKAQCVHQDKLTFPNSSIQLQFQIFCNINQQIHLNSPPPRISLCTVTLFLGGPQVKCYKNFAWKIIIKLLSLFKDYYQTIKSVFNPLKTAISYWHKIAGTPPDFTECNDYRRHEPLLSSASLGWRKMVAYIDWKGTF